MIKLKSEREIEAIARAGRIAFGLLKMLESKISPGVTTAELDRLAYEFALERGARCAFKGYKGFPGNICTSINEEIIHGIPTKRKRIKAGDIIGIDIGIKLDGYFADVAATFPVAEINPQVRKLIEVTREALFLGIRKASPYARLSDVSFAIQAYVESNGFSVVREFVGHGVGYSMHEEPEIPNFAQAPNLGLRLEPGMVLAIEPMVNMGGPGVKILSDGWTAVTADNKPSAHFEHTVAITENGPRILTLVA
jgi:methionyl aminopeptidase